MTITVDEAYRQRRIAEEAVRDILNDFMRKTGFVIDTVNVRMIDVSKMESPSREYCATTTIEVKL